MANVKLTELTAYTSPVSTDVLPIVDLVNNQTKKITIEDLLKRFGAGTEALPSFSFSGDIDTGIYSPGANQFAVTTGGTQRLLIDASGNTTIQGDLTVNGTATTVESNTLSVKDKNIEIAVVSTPTDTTADGGGITVKGASDKTINWVQSTGCWTLNQPTNFNNHVRIDSSGRVGMGTDSPGSYNASADNLVVQNDGGTGAAGITIRAGTGAQSTIYFADGTATADAVRGYVQYFHNGDFLRFGTDANERLRILSDGKMLLGLTTAIGTDGLQIGGSGNAGNGAFYRFDANDSGPFLQLAKSRNGTAGGNTVVQSGDELGTINFQGADGTDYHSAARIAAFVDGTPGNNDMPGRLVFSTCNDGASSPTEKVRITSAGNVGIGGTPANYHLEVIGSGSQALLIGSTDSQSAQLILDGDSNGDGAGADYASILHSTAGDLELNNRKNQSILFKTGSAEDERMRVTSDGKIGVGTVSPANQFEVVSSGATKANFTHASSNKTSLYIESDDTSARIGSTYYGSGGAFKPLQFLTAGQARVTIDSSGRLLLNGGSDVRMELGTNGTTGTNDRNHLRADGDNLKYNTCDSGNHIFEVNGNERMRLDANGNLGVGITNPSDYHANAHRLVVDGGMTLANASTSAIFFADSDSGTGEYVGQLNYDHASNYMQFVVNNSEAMKLDSSGNVTIGPYHTSPYVKGMKLFPDNSGRSTIVLNGTGTDHTALGVYDGNSSSYKLKLQHNGSASFGSPNSGSASGYGTSINIASNAGDIRAQCTSSASQYTQLFGAYYGTSKNFHVLANGDISGNSITAADHFKNSSSSNGLHNVANNTHWMSTDTNEWTARSNATVTKIKLQTTGSQTRGYLYCDSSSNFGLMDYAGNWILRAPSGGRNVELPAGNFTASGNITATTGWFYNTASGTGLHNSTNNMHFYSGNASTFFARSNTTSTALTFQTTGPVNRGSVYANDANEIGFLNQSGSWVLRCENDGDVFVPSGNFTCSYNVTAYSDITLKDNIETIPNALDKVSQIRGVTYNRNDLEGAPRQAGVIAQEVEKVLPEVVAENKDGLKTVAYGNLVGLLIQAVKELKAEVNELKSTRTFPLMVMPEVK